MTVKKACSASGRPGSTLTRLMVGGMLFLVLGCVALPEGIVPVQDFELQRYLGRWYEIARLDHSFERGLVNVTAEYTLEEDGRVAIRNVRRHCKDHLESEDVSEDEIRRAEKVLQEMTDQHIERLDEILQAKEEELLEV